MLLRDKYLLFFENGFLFQLHRKRNRLILSFYSHLTPLSSLLAKGISAQKNTLNYSVFNINAL